MTVTSTWTPIPTPQVLAYSITVTIFNSAGELVRSLYNGQNSVDPTGFTVVYQGVQPDGTIPVLLSLLGNGSLPGIVWNTDNNNGQPVAPGVYQIQVQVVNNLDTVTTYNQQAIVLSGTGSDNLSIFNSAGELVDQIPVGTLTTPALGFTLGGSSTGVAGLGTSNPIVFKVQVGANSTTTTVQWDGTNSQGQPVQSGVYEVRLLFVAPGTSEVIKVIPVAILNPGNAQPQKSVDGAIVAPQPYLAKNSAGLMVTYRRIPDMNMSARVYNLAGQLVLQGADVGGTGAFVLQANQLASGIYIVELQMDEGLAVMARHLSKIAVIH